ncbi:MAG: AAA family ATPase, partial [Candidatus Methanofastidiosa archaeon]|nr:AAA family ATPase [Candidatus Methanofastidiosa archaeon]
MMIKEVRLQNFKGYRNPNPIKFSCDKEKNVTLIYGVMGAGKTSFFEAINWALYGKKVEGKKNTIPDLTNIAGKYLLDELEENEQAEVKVEIDFEHMGYDYYLSRSAFFQKRKNKLNYLRENDRVKLYTVSDTSQSRTYDSTKGDEETIFKMISNILPFSSREYFLFDGEKLDKFSSIDSSSEIKNAIRQVLGLTDLENAKQNLKKIEKELSKEFNNLEGNNDQVRLTTTSINRIDDEVKNLEDRIVEDEELLIKVKKDFDTNEEKIDSFKEERGKIEKRKRLEKDIEETKTKLKTQRKKLRSLLTSAYSCYSINTIIKGINLLDKWQKEGKFPAEYYNLDFIDKILRERKCFFWSFEKDSEHERYFLSEKNRLMNWNRSTQEHLTQLFGDLKEYKEKSENLYKEIKKEHDVFVSLQGDLEENTYNLQQINRDIKSNITDDEMKKCEETRYRLTKEKNELETKIGI